MATLIFENIDAFAKREIPEDNGVTQDCIDMLYDGSLEKYEANNTGNTGCFNVVECNDCVESIECSTSSNLTKCNNCIDCSNSEELNNCTNCEDSSLLENCDNMVNCTDCKDCNYCENAEALTEESFVQGDASEDKEEDNAKNPQQAGTGEGATGNSIDPIGNLDDTGL